MIRCSLNMMMPRRCATTPGLADLRRIDMRKRTRPSGAPRPDAPRRGPCPPGAREIPLTQGQVAWVDEADYERVMNAGSWHARWSPHGGTYYAQKNIPDGKDGQTSMQMTTFLFGYGSSDHIDHDTLNNMQSNVREAESSENQRNTRLRVDSTSGVKGVSLHSKTGRWQAYIQHRKAREYLGLFDSKKEAEKARLIRQAQLHGEWSYQSSQDFEVH